MRWQVADDFAPLLPALLATKAVQVVKDDRAKFVARYEVNGRAFFLKRYRHGAFPLRPLKFLLKRSQGKQEWLLAEKLEKAGLPIVRHVALGERWSARGLVESVLITEAFNGVPIELRHAEHFPRVVDFVGQMARAGIVHADFHPANLLLNEQSGEIRLIDLYGLKLFPWYPHEDLCALLLAQLRVTLPLPVSELVIRMGTRLRKEKLSQRARRCLKNNRDFAASRFGKFCWRVRRSAVAPEVEAVLNDPDGFLSRSLVLKAGRSSTVGAANGLALKRHNFKKPLNPLKDLFRGSRGRRDFLKGYHLELCGVRTPRVIATADHRILGVPVRSFVLMEEIRDAVDASKAREEAMVNLGRLIGRLHEEGFTHRDLKETNILIDLKDVPHLIDLDGLNFVGLVTEEQAMSNLARLVRGLKRLKPTGPWLELLLESYCCERNLSFRAMLSSFGDAVVKSVGSSSERK